MLPGELIGTQFLAPETPIMQQNGIPNFYFNSFLTNFQNSSFTQPIQEFSPQASSLSNNSTSDEAEEQQLSIIDERKQRRMISNRESARRSRMRKQKHLDELRSQVVLLRTENHNLRTENHDMMDKLNHVSECHDCVLRENASLKEEVSDLRQMLSDMQLGSPFTATALRDLEEDPCNTAHLKAESLPQSITSSVDLLL